MCVQGTTNVWTTPWQLGGGTLAVCSLALLTAMSLLRWHVITSSQHTQLCRKDWVETGWEQRQSGKEAGEEKREQGEEA